MKWRVTFTQNYEYEIETELMDFFEARDEAFNKAYDEFNADMHRPIGNSTYDDYEVELLDND